MNKKIPVAIAVVVALLSAVWVSIRWKPQNHAGESEYTFRTRHTDDTGGTYSAGEIYSIEDEKDFKIAKILAVDEKAVHVRVYKNVFPLLIMRTTVSDEELGGYQEWKKAGGGVFGDPN